ncbi:MAG TPA: PEGA domain-containing protein [Bdellovibrionota bacterium]|nr:PEGA domain-containing protein [Bdellovibrionota bacterium]
MARRSRSTSLLVVSFFLGSQTVPSQNVAYAEEPSGTDLAVCALAGFHRGDHPSESEFQAALYENLSRSKRVQMVPDEVVAKNVERVWRDDARDGTMQLEKAFEDFRKGRELYQNLAIDEAIGSLDSAVRGYRQGISALRENRYLLASHLYLGMALIIRGDSKKGEEYIRQMIVLDPKRKTHELPSSEFPPKIVRLHRQLAKQVLAGPQATVSVRTEPKGATVFFDAVQQVPSPSDVANVPAGEHFLLVEKSGFRPYAQRVEVRGGKSSVDVELEPWMFLSPYAFERRRDPIVLNQLAQLGQDLGAHVLVLGQMTTKPDGNLTIAAQLFDTRSKEFSMIGGVESPPSEMKKAARALADQLLKNLTDHGLVIAQLSIPSDLKGTEGGSEGPATLPKVESGNPFYRQLWFWAIVGGVVAGGVGGALLLNGSGTDSSKNILVVDNPLN